MNLKKYLSIYRTSLIQSFAYRFNYLVWAILHPVYITIMYFVWTAIYSNSGTGAIAGMTLSQVIAYFVINSAFDRWVGIDLRVEEQVNRGTATIFFLRPISYFFANLAIELGRRTNAFFLHMLPTLIYGILILGFRFTNLTYTILGLISFVLAFLINFIYSFIIGLTIFWTKKYKGTYIITEGISWILSGGLVPIVFFPKVLREITMLTPLPYIEFTPPMIFLGIYGVVGSIKLILIQIFWIIALYFVWKIIFKKAYKKFTGVGV